jgi:hypothetical protein
MLAGVQIALSLACEHLSRCAERLTSQSMHVFMNDLLAFTIDSHGGIDRWSAFTKLKAEVSIDGAIWYLKQQPGLLTNKVIELDTHIERLTITPFTAADRRLVFAPNRLVLEGADGKAIEARDRPVDAFAGQTIQSPWDKFHVAYFAGEALWTYLTSPFLYTYPGFECEEIEPWQENGERWRRLKVTFPGNITSHTKTQITHFGPDGLMRRHDYTVDILGGATGANYVSDYREVQGIMMPTRRRIYAYDAAMQKVPEPLLVSLDFGNLTFS